MSSQLTKHLPPVGSNLGSCTGMTFRNHKLIRPGTSRFLSPESAPGGGQAGPTLVPSLQPPRWLRIPAVPSTPTMLRPSPRTFLSALELFKRPSPGSKDPSKKFKYSSKVYTLNVSLVVPLATALTF